MKAFLALVLALLTSSLLATTSPSEAFAIAQAGQAVFVDVREADELKSGMIQGARWFPLSRIQKGENWQRDFKAITSGKKIFLYCRSGNRSGQVQEILKGAGIESQNLGGYEDLRVLLPEDKP